MKEFRSQHPIRSTSVSRKSNYRDHRNQLAIDFNGRCGYTDCHSRWFGVKFEIDHFAPQNPDVDDDKKQAFSDLSSEYSNLVYSCPQVNRAKSNDWASDDPSLPIKDNKGYFDPCMDFNEHFYRTDGGGIMPKEGDEVALYMWRNLKLYLRRYEVFWRLELLFLNLRKLKEIRATNLRADDLAEVNSAMADLVSQLTDYLEYLGVDHNSIA